MTTPRETPLTEALAHDVAHLPYEKQAERFCDLADKLERTLAEARAALAVIVTHASDPHDGFTYSEIADYASKATARLDGSKL